MITYKRIPEAVVNAAIGWRAWGVEWYRVFCDGVYRGVVDFTAPGYLGAGWHVMHTMLKADSQEEAAALLMAHCPTPPGDTDKTPFAPESEATE